MNGAELMRKVTAGFAQSDLQPLLAAVHPDIVWKAASKSGPFRFSGVHKGRAGLIDVLGQIAMDYTFHRLDEKEITAGDNVVWGLFDATLSYNPKAADTRRSEIDLEIAIHWRLKDGKIIEHQAFFDTAMLLLPQDG